MTRSGEVEVARDYTKARRFPQLIGRTPDGMRIPGGPYTITEAVGVGLTLFIGYQTMGLWARFGFFINLAVLASVTFVVWFVLHRLPMGSRPPTSVATGALNSVTRPRHGVIAGKPLRLRRFGVVRHSFAVAEHTPPLADGERAAVVEEVDPAPSAGLDVVLKPAPQAKAPAGDPMPAIPMSNVQRLLAGTGR